MHPEFQGSQWGVELVYPTLPSNNLGAFLRNWKINLQLMATFNGWKKVEVMTWVHKWWLKVDVINDSGRTDDDPIVI